MDFDVAAGVALPERTPRTLREMLAGLPPEWIDATEGPETWSLYVISVVMSVVNLPPRGLP